MRITKRKWHSVLRTVQCSRALEPQDQEVVNPFWTFREFIADLKRQCVETIRADDQDPNFKAYSNTVVVENLDILEIRLNTCRGVAKAIYYDLLLLYYDERRIGDHLVNDYFSSEHTVIQVYVTVGKERKPPMSSSSLHLDHHQYTPSPVSSTVRALIRLNMLQAWQSAYNKYKDTRIRHVLYPKGCKENDFTRIGIVEPFRANLGQAAVSVARKTEACVVQVLAYDKFTKQSAWFDLVIDSHSTVRRCKERIADALAHILDWAEASVEAIPHLIARRYHNGEMEDFLLCDDTLTLSYLLPPTSPSAELSSTFPMLTVIAFVGRHGRRISDSKGRCVFDEEEHGTQLLMAAMAMYLNNYVNRRASYAVKMGGKEVDVKETEETRKTSSKVTGSEKSKAHAKVIAKERRISTRASIESSPGRQSCCVVS